MPKMIALASDAGCEPGNGGLDDHDDKRRDAQGGTDAMGD